MNSEIISILLLFLLIHEIFGGTGPKSHRRKRSSTRIVGGDKAPSDTWYPSVVLHDGCAATIINEVWLLTAAHCEEFTSEIAQAGNPFNYHRPESEQRRGIISIIKHEEYDNVTLFNDIALYQVDEPFQFTEAVQPIKLIRKDYKVPVNTMATVVGWGLTDAQNASDADGSKLIGGGGWDDRFLHHVDVPILSKETCIKAIQDYEEEYHPGMMCAGYMEEGGKDACSGDSGGPLYATESGKPPSQTPWQEHFQVGIVSFGNGCAQPGKPGFYTEIQPYLDWIEKTMRENPHESSTLNSGGLQKTVFVFSTILALVVSCA